MRMPGFRAEASLSPAVANYRTSSVVGPSESVFPQVDAITFFQPFGFSWLGQTGSAGGSAPVDPKENCFRLCDLRKNVSMLDCDTEHSRNSRKRRDCYSDARDEQIECYFDCSG